VLVLSLTSLVEEASLSDPQVKRLSGNVDDVHALLREDALRALEQAHGGPFAFIAFDPSADEAMRSYISSGSLADDSGPHILVLFTVSKGSGTTRQFDDSLLSFLTIDDSHLPALDLVRYLFEPGLIPPLPGLLVFESFTEPRESLYFDLTGPENQIEVRHMLRMIFSLTDMAWRSSARSGREFAEILAVDAQRQRLSFVQSRRVSLRQWLVRSYQWAGDNASDIVAAIGLASLA
jgi:hypothetical protein